MLYLYIYLLYPIQIVTSRHFLISTVWPSKHHPKDGHVGHNFWSVYHQLEGMIFCHEKTWSRTAEESGTLIHFIFWWVFTQAQDPRSVFLPPVLTALAVVQFMLRTRGSDEQIRSWDRLSVCFCMVCTGPQIPKNTNVFEFMIIIWLVVWNIFYFFHILGIIIPTD